MVRASCPLCIIGARLTEKKRVSKETRLRMSAAHLGKPARKHVPVEMDGQRYESPKDLMEATGWTKSRVRWLLQTGRIQRLPKGRGDPKDKK